MPILLRPNKKANSKKSLTQPMLLCFRTILSAWKSSATWAKQLSNQNQNEQQGQLLAPRVWAPSWTPQKRFAQKAVHLLPLHLCLWLYRHLPCSSIVPQRFLCLDKKSKTICLVMYRNKNRCVFIYNMIKYRAHKNACIQHVPQM